MNAQEVYPVFDAGLTRAFGCRLPIVVQLEQEARVALARLWPARAMGNSS
ncbi:hypothetical protein [Yoonia sediminilitoris]|uniref:Uncharacterized protein n=1 Tax=Yoonia sediminilitoris TaxID=1286148 RepID=A0A2T6KR35_9RHOB|nr:hypothetical protein [Yoonia sediminilitoris]PUB18995.1 hypothetical protein C8N45_101586 [Yoonia sediminilitoris]RCW99163.1 hypothetical protein DFP92_101586 [Yoonia sediminilitoris]